jgi:hypothetical protein
LKPRVAGALFSIWARRRTRAVEELSRRAPEVQAETLEALVATAGETIFGNPAGGAVGDLSGVMSAEMPFWLKRRVLPSSRFVAIRNWEMKLEVIA